MLLPPPGAGHGFGRVCVAHKSRGSFGVKHWASEFINVGDKSIFSIEVGERLCQCVTRHVPCTIRREGRPDLNQVRRDRL